MGLKDEVRPQPSWSIWIGYEPRELAAFAVARQTVRKSSNPIPVYGLSLDRLRRAGLYTRPTTIRTSKDGKTQLWDDISDAPMSTEFAVSRFLVPHLASRGGAQAGGWALFMDCDQMLLKGANISDLFHKVAEQTDKAIVCVKHSHVPKAEVKMDGQQQTVYPYKNWSSFMFFNLGHKANAALTVDLVNSVPGRDLHAFCWLPDGQRDKLIGEIPVGWNWLAGHSPTEAKIMNVHYTDGVPAMEGYDKAPFAEIWFSEFEQWVIGKEYPRFTNG